MSMGKVLSSILPCCVKPDEEESNPNQRLIDENATHSSYTAETQNNLEPTMKSPGYSENSTTSTTSVYYTPSSSFKDTPVTSVEVESTGIAS